MVVRSLFRDAALRATVAKVSPLVFESLSERACIFCGRFRVYPVEMCEYDVYVNKLSAVQPSLIFCMRVCVILCI